MKFKTFFLIIAVIAVHNQLFAQSVNNLIGPSPNAAAFDKYGNIPVSTYTGIPNISIPITTLSNKQINVPISLSYYAGGIKVYEDASRIGLGWVLNCGGVINRSIRGTDDFHQPYGYLNNSLPEIFDSGATEYLQVNYSNLSTPDGTCSKTIAGESIDLSTALPGAVTDPNNMADLEPDLFSYNFLGYSGKFTITKAKKIIAQSPSNLQFQLMANDGTIFQVTTPEGNKLTFNVNEYAQNNLVGGQRYISSWYLTKIVSVTGAEIDFHYTIGQGNSLQIPVYQHQDSNNIFTREVPISKPGSPVNAIGSGWVGTAGNTLNYDQVLLDSVSSNIGSVILSYSDRIDVAGDKKITSLRVHNYSLPQNDRIFVFNQGYFTSVDYNPDYNIPPAQGGTFPNAQTLYQNRLQLQSMSQQDATGQNLGNYIFSYNPTLPNKGSFGYDYWGFNNGVSNNTTSIPLQNYYDYVGNIATFTQGSNRTPNGLYSSYCLLNQIKYPTGGITKLDYEPNDFDIGNSVNGASHSASPDLQTVRSSALTSIGNDLTFTFNVPAVNTNTGVTVLIQSQNASSPITQPYPSAIPGAAYLEVFAPGSTTPLAYWDLSYEGNWTVPDGGGYVTYTQSFTPPVAGTYTFKSHFSSSETFLNYINIQPSTTYDQNYSTNRSVGIGGGVRIKRITDTDPVTGVSSIKKFIYHYQQDTNGDGILEDFSFGKRLSNIKFTSYGYRSVCVSNGQDLDPTATDYFPFTIFSNNLVTSLSPLVGYSQVTVLNGENGENGKSEFHYTNNLDNDLSYTGAHSGTDLSISIPDLRPAGIAGLADLTNGSLLEKIDYSYDIETNNFLKLKDAINTYSSSATLTQAGISKISLQISTPCSYGLCPWLLAGYPAFQTSWTHLLTETVNDYSPETNTYLQTQTSYLFETTPIHYQPIQTTVTTSTGRTLNDVSVYPSDYAPGTTFIDDMKANNIVEPIEKVTYQVNGGATSILSGKLNTYLPGGKGLTDKQYRLETNSPIPLSSFQFSNETIGQIPDGTSGSTYSNDFRYIQRSAYGPYDNLGDPLQITPQYGPSTSYQWGYNHEYPVAKVENAPSNDIFFDSFEEGNGNSTVNDSRTGHFSFNGVYQKNLTGLDNGNYILSFWYKGKGGAGWIYASQTVPVTNGTYTISLNAPMDDVCFYPANAQMETYTYDPLVGMTSMTDAKGKTTYYEYDSFQRLINIKDYLGNIVKSYCYNYAGQTTGCSVPAAPPAQPTVYQSDAQPGSFTKSDCDANSTGTTVPYTVPKGMFTSTISIADANQQAIAYLNAQGPINANLNGSCTPNPVPNVPINLNNTTNSGYQVNFSNTTSSITLTFNNNGIVLPTPTVPAGTYNINVYPTDSGPEVPHTIELTGQPDQVGTPRASYTGYVVAPGPLITLLIY